MGDLGDMYRLAFEHMLEGFSLNEVITDEQGRTVDFRILDANAAWERHTGVPRQLAIGRTIREVMPNADARQIEAYGRVARTGEPMTVEYESKTFGRFFRVTAFCPSPGRFGAVFDDITERKRTEQELRALNATLEARVQEEVASGMARERMLAHQARLAAVGEMLGNIAHQWRQPLSGLSILLANLKDTYRFGELTEARLAEDVGRGSALVRQMSSTISDFSNFFRPDKESVPFSLRAQADATAGLVAASFHASHVALEVEGDVSVWAVGVPNEFAQVLLNLLTNALDAIRASGRPDGRARVLVSRDRGLGSVRVVDNGGGITLNPVDRVFEPYVTTKDHGLGVGLYMARTIVERSLSGSLTARNVDGGAAFTIELPLASPPRTDST